MQKPTHINISIFYCFLILMFVFISQFNPFIIVPKTYAQTCSGEFSALINGAQTNACTAISTTLDANCQEPSVACQISQFCRKFSGDECCTVNIAGGLGFDSCKSTGFIPWIFSTNIGFFQCCFNPTPTPTPTPISVSDIL